MGFESMPQPKKVEKDPTTLKIEEQERRLRLERQRETQEFLRNKWAGFKDVLVEWGGERKIVKAPPGSPMTWNRNNETLAAVGPDGNVYVTPATESALKKLEELGFNRDSSMGVPMSNMETPISSDFKEVWERLQRLARMERAAVEREQKEAA